MESAESQQRAVTEFSPQLAPYGRWVDDPYYGRVWVPARTVVGAEFRPYVTGGHWGMATMHERAQAIGGRLRLVSQPGQGTNLEMVAPLLAP